MRGLNFIVTRSVWLLLGTALLLLVFSLGLLVYSAWRYADRIDPVQRHLHYLSVIEMADFDLRTELISLLKSEVGYLDPGELKDLRGQLRDLRRSGSNLMTTTPSEIDQALQQLAQFDGKSQYLLDDALHAIRFALNQELVAHQSMVVALEAEARQGLRMALGLALGLLVISALLWALVHRRIVAPLNRLADQMTLLGRRDYSELALQSVDPLLFPIFEKYNRMTQRLRKLENIHQQRHQTLTEEVRNATYVLLQQQYRVAQAERLGAIGELAAGIAHDLRNPLTSVQMALQNLRRDIEDPDTVDRLDMITNEVKRVTRQLNEHLDQVRQRPEPPVTVDIGAELEALVSLAVFQLQKDISVHLEVEEPLTCLLPHSRLRQALLNLILNAGQVLGDKAGEIVVRARRQESFLELTVADSGPGFPPTILEAGAQPFRSLRVGGTGLGLVMVRRFTSDLGGKLLLRNRDEGGACVTLRLPCKPIHG